MADHEHLFLHLPWDNDFSVGEVAVGERRIDADLVLAVRERIQRFVAQAKPPVFLVERVAVGDPRGAVGQRIQPWA